MITKIILDRDAITFQFDNKSTIKMTRRVSNFVGTFSFKKGILRCSRTRNNFTAQALFMRFVLLPSLLTNTLINYNYFVWNKVPKNLEIWFSFNFRTQDIVWDEMAQLYVTEAVLTLAIKKDIITKADVYAKYITL